MPAGDSARLERLYGAHSAAARRGQQRYFVNRTSELDFLDLNTSRPLFASARMRRAVAYARRPARARGGRRQLRVRHGSRRDGPAARRARATATTTCTRSFPTSPRHDGSPAAATTTPSSTAGSTAAAWPGPRIAQIVKNNLAAIGIDVHVHCMPGGEMFPRIFRRKEPWDIFIDGYGSDYDDPGDYINALAVDDAFNFSHYHGPALSRTNPRRLTPLRRPARPGLRPDRPRARPGHRAGSSSTATASQQDLFSARIGCQLYQPVEGMDLGALCIRASSR